MTGENAERVAAAVNKLALDLRASKEILTEDALVLLICHTCNISISTVRQVLRGIDRLPEKVLTPHGRGIRIRD
jgi:hypothetical protein